MNKIEIKLSPDQIITAREHAEQMRKIFSDFGGAAKIVIEKFAKEVNNSLRPTTIEASKGLRNHG